VRFLVDTQLPSGLARWLTEQGCEAKHVLELGLAQAKGSAIWQYALAQRSAIITKDEDFAVWILQGRPGPSVVWLRIGNSSNRAMIAWLTPLLPAILRQLDEGERLIEVR
jgi:predicted nuclease of predicted toxin-antitoxin system